MNTGDSHASRWTWIIALASISAFAVLYGRSIHAPCDDAYIFYVYAQNFIEGNGLTFNGMVVWGFTSVLWVGALSLVGLLGIPIHVGGEILSGASAVFAVWMTYGLGRALGLSRTYALAPPLLLAATGDFAFYSSVGLEQVLFVGLVAATAAATIPLGRDVSKRQLLGVALLMATTVLTRPEGALICGLMLLLWAIRGRSLGPPVACGLVLTGLLLPVLLAMHAYFGDWLPSTYYAKSNAGLANLPHGLRYMLMSTIRYGLLALVAALLLVRVIRADSLQPHIDAISLLVVAVIWLAYVTVQGGDNMVGGRFLIPILPLVYVALVDLLPPMSTRTLASGIAAMCALLLLSYAADPWARRHRESWRESFVVRRDAGIHLRDHYPADTLVALGPAGIVPYYSGLPTIDTLGLNNRHIARFGTKDRQLRFAHQSGDGKYVLSQEPDIVIFGGALSPGPSGTISDQEIWESDLFHEHYVRADWDGIGTVWVRTNEGEPPTRGKPADAPLPE